MPGRAPKMSEYELQKAVVEHLQARQRPNVYWCAIPNGEYRSKATAGKLKAMGVRPGAPDLLVIVNREPHGIELKSKGGRLSASQRRAHIDWENAGGNYWVGEGLDMTLDLLVTIGAIHDEYDELEKELRKAAGLERLSDSFGAVGESE